MADIMAPRRISSVSSVRVLGHAASRPIDSPSQPASGPGMRECLAFPHTDGDEERRLKSLEVAGFVDTAGGFRGTRLHKPLQGEPGITASAPRAPAPARSCVSGSTTYRTRRAGSGTRASPAKRSTRSGPGC
jgi:hypothetical protein